MYKTRFVIFLLLIQGLTNSCRQDVPVNSQVDSFILNEDTDIEGVGRLDSGTIIQYVRGYDEGFVLYKLSLNIPMNIEVIENVNTRNEADIIYPYWLKKRQVTSVE
jgi:hypothetical protein